MVALAVIGGSAHLRSSRDSLSYIVSLRPACKECSVTSRFPDLGLHRNYKKDLLNADAGTQARSDWHCRLGTRGSAFRFWRFPAVLCLLV